MDVDRIIRRCYSGDVAAIAHRLYLLRWKLKNEKNIAREVQRRTLAVLERVYEDLENEREALEEDA